MSSLFWAVFDKKQKDKTEEILATFDKDSKDEMGLMSITIALSSLMFPGTSVLHTRLRYVYLVGWILLEAMKSRETTIEILHKKEKLLRKVLQAGKKEDPNSFVGILGATKRIDSNDDGEKLSQPPFNIYFNLLKEWNIIIDKSISVSEIYRDAFDPKYLRIIEDEKFKNNSFQLSEAESKYIVQQIPESILHTIFSDDVILKDKEHFIDFDISKIPDENQKEIFKNSQNFSLLMWGTMLYYDYYLGNESSELTDKFENWKDNIKVVMSSRWKPDDTLQLIEDIVSNSQKTFIESWFIYVKNNIENLNLEKPQLIENKHIEYFLEEREKGLKGDRSRLLKKQNGEVLKEAKFGINPIQYRWSNILRFKKDFDNATN